jgi:predicted nucleotidyltransferase
MEDPSLSLLSSQLASRLSSAEAAAVRALVEGTRVRLGPLLLEARLFGSRARGEGHEESDVDVAIIVAAGGRERRREVHDLAYDLSLEIGVPLAPLVIELPQLEELRARERLLARDLDRDGILL